MRQRQLKDKTVQRAIVLLYLRLRRARKYYHMRDDHLSFSIYLEAHNALESMKNVLWHGEYPHIGREYRFLGREWPHNQQAQLGAGRSDAA